MLGILLGIAIIVVFVFLLSEQTIDAPELGDDRPPAERPAKGAR